MKSKFFLVAIIIAPIIISNCKKDPPTEPEPEPAVYDDTPYNFEYGSFIAPEFGDNPLTEQGVKLGKMLFYETLLSQDNSISCASCHNQKTAFSDTNQFSAGVGGSLGKRQAMAIFNMAWHQNEFFWDGRAHLLRDQALKPIEDGLEMKETLENVILKLEASSTYTDQFIRAFGNDSITSEKISLALEQFMKSIVSNRSKYDKFLAGESSLSNSEERGRQLFLANTTQAFQN